MGRLRRVDFPWHKRESQRLEAQPSRAGLEPASRATRFTGGGDYVKCWIYVESRGVGEEETEKRLLEIYFEISGKL